MTTSSIQRQAELASDSISNAFQRLNANMEGLALNGGKIDSIKTSFKRMPNGAYFARTTIKTSVDFIGAAVTEEI